MKPKAFSNQHRKMNYCAFNSVEVLPDMKAAAAFTVNSAEVFKEQEDTLPITLDKGYQYMPWGADNQMPYRILEMRQVPIPCYIKLQFQWVISLQQL